MTDDDALEAFVRKAAIGVWHASCTCRMGGDDDPMAVVDTPGPRAGRAGPARRRRLDLPGRAVRQHQLPDADDGGEDLAEAILLPSSCSCAGGAPLQWRVLACEPESQDAPLRVARRQRERAMSVVLGSGEHRLSRGRELGQAARRLGVPRRRRGRRRQQGPRLCLQPRPASDDGVRPRRQLPALMGRRAVRPRARRSISTATTRSTAPTTATTRCARSPPKARCC